MHKETLLEIANLFVHEMQIPVSCLKGYYVEAIQDKIDGFMPCIKYIGYWLSKDHLELTPMMRDFMRRDRIAVENTAERTAKAILAFPHGNEDTLVENMTYLETEKTSLMGHICGHLMIAMVTGKDKNTLGWLFVGVQRFLEVYFEMLKYFANYDGDKRAAYEKMREAIELVYGAEK